MRAAYMLPAIVLITLTACSTPRTPPTPGVQAKVPVAEVIPTGTFVGPGVVFPVVKLRLEVDGTYIAEDTGPPEFWMMMEGNRIYPQRIKFRPQRGRWAWDRWTGRLTLTAEEFRPTFRWA